MTRLLSLFSNSTFKQLLGLTSWASVATQRTFPRLYRSPMTTQTPGWGCAVGHRGKLWRRRQLELHSGAMAQRRSRTGAPRWHKNRSGGCTQTASKHSFLETVQNLTVIGLETPPVAMNCSCTSNAAFRSAFCVFAN